MGAFYSPNKGTYFWGLVSYLADNNVWLKDASLLPYTPSRQQVYMDLFPNLYSGNPYYPTVLSVWINDVLVAYGFVNTPAGLFYSKISVPPGKFKLEIRDETGEVVITTEYWNSKNYAMFLGVMAQSLEERMAGIKLAGSNQNFATIQSGWLYDDLGEFFNFPPPPSWTTQQYRNAILGDGGTHPGFTKSFFKGGTTSGVVETIQSITGVAPTFQRVKNVYRWVLYDDAHAPSPLNEDALASFLLDDTHIGEAVTAPNGVINLMDDTYYSKAVVASIPNSENVVVSENVLKVTDSFIQAPVLGPFVLDGLTLQFSVQRIDVLGTPVTYSVVFPEGTTTGNLAATAIGAAYPSLGASIYAIADGHLRIGIPPVDGQVLQLTIVGGTACTVLGLIPGQSLSVQPDALANPWILSSNPATSGKVTITWNSQTYTQGGNYTIDTTTGAIIWAPSSPTNPTVPPAGSAYQASYTYQMRREIQQMAQLAKAVNSALVYQYT